MRDPSVVAVSQVADQLGLSHKHFIDCFRAQVGLTPKRFCRVRRFQRALAGIGAGGAVDWAQLACACGYFDQAHFIHDFRAFSGLKPSAYLAQRGELLNFVPADG